MLHSDSPALTCPFSICYFGESILRTATDVSQEQLYNFCAAVGAQHCSETLRTCEDLLDLHSCGIVIASGHECTARRDT